MADEFAKAAKAAGVDVVSRQYTNDKATDFNAILTAIKGKSPDLVFFGGMDAVGGPMLRQMKQLGVNAKTSEIEANVLTNQKVEVERNANQANANLDAVLGTDSGNRNGDFGAVKRKFCADHPNDSKCK